MNVVQKALASSFLVAAGTLFSGGASASPEVSPTAACTALGQNQGVYEYPAARKAFQQSGSLGCEYGYGPGQQFVVLGAYNLNDARQANTYARNVGQAENLENRVLQQQQRQMQQQQQRDARDNNAARQLNGITRDFRSIDPSIGWATLDQQGGPTGVGAILGGAVGHEVGNGRALGTIAGAVVGGVVGNMFEKDCQTQFNSNLGRNVNGNATGQWRGSETMNTKCQYSGNNAPANLNAPQHLQHMQKNGTSPWR